MRKTITTELFKKIMALAKELGLPVNLGTRTNVIPHPAYKDLTTSIADAERLQMTSVEDVKSIFELSVLLISMKPEAIHFCTIYKLLRNYGKLLTMLSHIWILKGSVEQKL